MTAFTLLTESDEGVQVFLSEPVTVATTITFDRLGADPADFATSDAVLYPYTLGYGGVAFYDSIDADTYDAASGGTYRVNFTSAACPQANTAVATGVSAAAPAQFTWTGPLGKLAIVPNSIVGTTHWRATVVLVPQGVR